MSSIRPRYVQMGSYGHYALYPVSMDHDDLCPATFTYDNMDVEKVKEEHQANEARMDLEEAAADDSTD
ncbi:MAG: hypothetical protein HRU12_19710 [Phaeodactylibacter sp.]|nr:hypothetical protein [Phaeodactylibacter sp.]